MTRLLFWIALIVLVGFAVRSKLRAMLAAAEAPPPGMGPVADPGQAAGVPRRVDDDTERMACCAHCGLHFPASEAVRANGREYCCAAHASAG